MQKQHINKKKSFQKLEKKMLGQVGRAVTDFHMIEEGDRVMVCISGGKDSWCMLHLLEKLRQRAPIRFELLALHLHQGEPYTFPDEIEEALKLQDVPSKVVRRQLYDVVETRLQPGQMRCSLCSRLRRGALYNIAVEENCQKIALGHHRDDMIETLLMNQFFTGRISSMPAKLHSDDGRNIVLRPLAYVAEEDLIELSSALPFPIFPCVSCDHLDGKRGRIKKLLQDLEQESPGIKQTLLRSLSNIKPSQLMDRDLWNFKEGSPKIPKSKTTASAQDITQKVLTSLSPSS